MGSRKDLYVCAVQYERQEKSDAEYFREWFLYEFGIEPDSCCVI